MISLWAGLLLGAVLAPGNRWWGTDEIAHAVELTAPAVIIADTEMTRLLPAGTGAGPGPAVVPVADILATQSAPPPIPEPPPCGLADHRVPRLVDYECVRRIPGKPDRPRRSVDLCAPRRRRPAGRAAARAPSYLGHLASGRATSCPARLHRHLPGSSGVRQSRAPAPAADHTAHSKRVAARDIVAVMRALGHHRFALAGHDRGSYVAPPGWCPARTGTAGQRARRCPTPPRRTRTRSGSSLRPAPSSSSTATCGTAAPGTTAAGPAARCTPTSPAAPTASNSTRRNTIRQETLARLSPAARFILDL